MNSRRPFFALAVALFCCALNTSHELAAQATAPLPIMPLPASAVPGDGEFLIDGHFGVALEGYKEPRLERAQTRFLGTLSRETGILFAYHSAETQPHFVIRTKGPSAAVQQVGEDESYSLKVSADGVELSAANPLGTMHGLQTFLQLVRVTPRGFTVPVVTIEDKPRFPWRGLMTDAGRHFIPVPVIERDLDGMEAVKMNVFHWHLSEDQGFRVESKVFPLLQQKGSDGMYYTQEEIRHVIEYARDRGIRVVPEFDMPGHAGAWFVGYPDLASGKGPYHIERHWGIFDPAMDPTRESTYQFLNLLIGEMTALFPDAYFHVGGDECNGKEWDRNPRIQEFMKAHQLKDNAALQAYFSGRVQKLVAAHHKIMEGWDEVLQPETPKDVVIQSWRGRESLLEAAKRGYRGLLSNGYYIDLNEAAEKHYLVDPLEGIADKLTPEQAASVLGGEATIWSEFVTPETIDSRIWPRTAAIAERLWSPQNVRDVDSMYERMAVISQKLQYYGLQYQAAEEVMLERMSGDSNPEALRVLASVVQPPKGYDREGLHEYSSLESLNHMVDAVPPESETARSFGLICKKIAAGKATPEEVQQAHDWLVLWRDNDAKLQPRLAHSDITAELVPVSHSLNTVAAIGLHALDALGKSESVSAEQHKTDLDAVKAAEKPQAVLLLKVAPSVELLVNATKVQ
ncbi:beta-N-acetylhexosaminidase [Acidicapsa ligni]|uniref:beta-N-acetylhexosaminidase n=1 Tax=Acidicapsa ligni TaxID=542300 RepID=UPI0021E0E225|nr:family 20 glycosylhydrolase [Acidicapsa ligni]